MFDDLSVSPAVESSEALPSELTVPQQQATVRSRPAKGTSKKRQRSNGLGPCYQRKEDSRWVAILNVKGPNGERKRKPFYGTTEAEALAARLAAIQTKPDAFTAPTTNQTVEQWLTQWLAIVKPELADSSYLDYSGNVTRFLIPGLGKRKLAELKALDVKLWLTKLQEEGATSAKVRRLAMILKLAYNRAVELDVLPASQIKKLKLPKHKAKEMQVWDEEQIGRFLAACAGDPMEPLFVLLFDTGMRIGEVLGLRWEYLTLEVINREEGPLYRGSVKVRHALKELRGRVSLGDTKTEAGKREITLADETVRQLLTHKDRMVKAGKLSAASPTGFVFLSKRGTPLRKKGVYPTFQRYAEKVGNPRIRVHDARHSVASVLLANGINAVAIRDTLGHTDIKVTLGTYAHLMKATDTRRSSIMNDVLTRRNRKEA